MLPEEQELSQNLFILGAGFTKAIFPNAPLNDELLFNLIGKKPNTSPLGRVWSEYSSSNIEVLLTKFDLDLISGNSKFTSKDRDAINSQLAKFVSQYRFEADIPWLHPILHTISDNDVIASLNYDCFLEGFLDFHGAWSPKGGYHNIPKPLENSLPENDRNIRILKLHGSESFRLSHFDDKPGSVLVGIEINAALFPRSGKNVHDLGGGFDSRPYLIAPSFAKQFVRELQYLMLDAIRFARSARNLIIIGCGLRPEDSHLWLVITSFLKTKLWKKRELSSLAQAQRS